MTSLRPRRLREVLAGAVLVGACAVTPSASAASATPRTVEQGGHAAARTSPAHLQQWWYDAMRLGDAQRVSTGKGVVVAVIDRYVNPAVPDLKGADVEIRQNCRGRAMPKVTDDVADHGTAMVTAIVGQGTGNGPGGRGVLGVAPDATVRFYSTDTDPTNDFGECDAFEIGPLIVKAARQGADIISVSLGLGASPTFHQEYLRKAEAYGAVVVAASGEKSGKYHKIMDYPGGIPGVVAVNAADYQGRPWALNPDATSLDGDLRYPTITAPGVAAQLGGYVGARWVSGATRTGTSGATAITAGALALVKSRWPESTNNQLIQALVHWPGNDHRGNLTYDKRLGYGLLAINNVLAVDPTKYPDVNPLLKGPQQAIKDFPASVYGAAEGSTGSGDTAGSTAKASPSSSAATTSRGSRAGDGSGGVPVWVWPLGGVVLVGLAGALLAVRRRGTSSPSTAPSTTSAPERVPSSSGSHHRTEGE